MLRHTPVLARETFENLPNSFGRYFDGTFGHWGHVEYLLNHREEQHPGQKVEVIACDLDQRVMDKGEVFIGKRNKQVKLLHSSYAAIRSIWEQEGKFDFMLLDLGVNMEHFKDGERGFSIKTDADLDMRFNQDAKTTAKDIVNHYSLQELVRILIKYGDFSEKSAEYFAKGIIEERKKKKIESTWELKEILYNLHCNQKKIAVIFQVLRIETNKELEQLEQFLQDFPNVLTKWGRCAIMTYHSIEDRITKFAFKALEEGGKFRLVHKKVIQPHYKEVEKNKAARSAKLRIIEKVV